VRWMSEQELAQTPSVPKDVRLPANQLYRDHRLPPLIAESWRSSNRSSGPIGCLGVGRMIRK
jgi:hypothetical protein